MVLGIVFVCILSCRGSDGQISSRDEGAHVRIMGEDVVADKLTEEQHQVHKFHLLALAVGVRCVRNKFSQRVLDQTKNKEKTKKSFEVS